MTWRGLALALAQVALGALGWWLGQAWGALAGVVLASWLWLAWDMWHARKLLLWLRSTELPLAPSMSGVWGELATRMRRWLRLDAQQVQQSEQRLQDIFSALQASPNGLILLDATGHIEWCNQTAEQQFGLDAERDLQQSIGNLVRDPAFSAYWTRHDFVQPVLLQGRDSTPGRPMRLSVQLYAYGDGRHLLLSRDITALEQAEAMRRDFVANVSHEIRTPLTVLLGFVETLQTLPLEEGERKRYLSLMAQQAARMQSLVQDLLTLSRLEGSPWPARDDWIPLAPLLSQCEDEASALSDMLTRKAGAPHALVFPTAAALQSDLAGVSAELHSAFSNLISNAIRYTPPGGSITVRWQPHADGSATFSVQDSGRGIDPEHVGRLTERFYRIDRSRSRETGGTGLGLAIVKHVLQRHGAQLHIASVLGQGSTFSATFPAGRLRPHGPAYAAQA
ncbi:phosphate regulon sensor histidine kinase PhoR [Comamonas sp. GB3 AK4-5]|uniref:phosphate regulon sensor histidine kinase PhoR n=1 Tax=Comamonas sp. GB3 AK4-5 TaxID=3231487 RepID=UPI00351EBCD4